MMARIAHGRMRNLPVATLDAVAPGTALVLAPHADDESLGCGGLIAMASARGRPPIIVCVTDGTGSHRSSPTYPAARLRQVREAELRAAAAILGVASERVRFLGLPDAGAPLEGPEFEDAAQRVARLVRVHAIETLFATWSHDPHCDHEATARLGEAVAAVTGARLRLLSGLELARWPPDRRFRSRRSSACGSISDQCWRAKERRLHAMLRSIRISSTTMCVGFASQPRCWQFATRILKPS